MNQQFRSFLETSCFSSNYPFECDPTDPILSAQEAKRETIRKLSFRDNFELPTDTTDASGDFLSDLFFARNRKMTDEMVITNPSPKQVCLSFDSSDQDQEPHTFFQPGHRQQAHLFARASTQQPFGIENYPHSTNIPDFDIMEEECEDSPVVQQLPKGIFLMDRVNGERNLHNNESKEAQKGSMEVQNLFATARKSDSPTSCLVKAKSDDSEWVFESPALGKRFNNSSLVTCKNLRDPDLRTITPETLIELMGDSQKKRYLVIDCRYGYEYKGGHIKGAINVTSPDDLEQLLFKNRHLLCRDDTLELIKKDWLTTLNAHRLAPTVVNEDPFSLNPPILIFHCEFSQKRGPRALRAMRNLDRNLNSMNWPNLYYPEVYILENGYKNFHSKFPDHCDPINQYIRMVDKNYRTHYIEAKTKDRTVWKTKDTNNTNDPTLKPTVLKRFKTMVCL